MDQVDKVAYVAWGRRRGRAAAARTRHPGSVLFWTACLVALWTLGGLAAAADSGARPMSREFDPIDILAWEILAGIEASDRAPDPDEALEEAPTRIAVWPFSADEAPVPASLANEYNDKLLVSLLSQGGSRHRFIAREALSTVVKEIGESASRDAELDRLLAALVENAKADVLVVGKLRRTSDETIVLSYEAVRVRDGTILAATSHQHLPLDPAEVALAARTEAPAPRGKLAAPPGSDDVPATALVPRAVPEAGRLTSTLGLAVPSHQVASVQADLLELGYDPGPLDGLMGARTRAAIRAYQHDAGLAVDGRISGRLIDGLRRDLAAHRAYAGKARPAPVAPVRAAPVAVRPVRPDLYRADGTYCREYQHAVRIGGAEQASYGKACLRADGSWQIVK